MNYSRITDYLYIGTTPKGEDYAILHEFGVSLVINTRFGAPPRRDPISPSIRSVWLPVIDSPFIPIPIRALEMGVQEALKVIEAGGVVYAHCSRGRHRGAALGACILIAQGMAVEQALQLIKQQRPISDLQAWYIQSRIIKFERIWKERK